MRATHRVAVGVMGTDKTNQKDNMEREERKDKDRTKGQNQVDERSHR